MQADPTLPSKQHFAGLDALRGIAAISVMWMHLRGVFSPGGATVQAALAVDLFFMLSGFVIAYSYGAKLDLGMQWRAFMIRRVIRLYPMLVLGVLLGFAVLMAKQAFHAPLQPDEHAINLLPNLLMIPIGLIYSSPTYPFEGPATFVFDAPMWSLFFEFIVYGLFALPVCRRLTTGSTTVAILVSAFVLLLAGLWMGKITELGFHGLIGFLGGFPRSIAPFLLGALLYSSRAFERFPRVPFWLPALVVILALNIPSRGIWYKDAIMIFGLFPLVICFTARSFSGKTIARLSDFVGRLSYPVYLLHVPVAIGAGFAIKTVIPIMQGYALIVACAALTLIGSWLSLVLYDEPVRRALTMRLMRRSSARALNPAATV